MPLFYVSLTLWVTPPGGGPLSPLFIGRLRDELMNLHRTGCISDPFVTGNIRTATCQVTLSVHAEDITAAPVTAGRAVVFAADNAAPTWRIEVGRVVAQPGDPGPVRA